MYIKVAKIVHDRKSKMAATAAILKIYFKLLLLNGKVNWLETSLEVSRVTSSNYNPGVKNSPTPGVACYLTWAQYAHG